MISSRDLASAQAFHRRRLVAAFVSAFSTESTDRPPRTLRCVVAGMLAGTVCAAGVGVSTAVGGHPDVSWVHGGLRVSP